VTRCLHGYADDRPCDRCAPPADERRVEVAAEAIDAHLPELPDHRRTVDYAARAVVAALDAHDGDLRERLAGAVEARAAELDSLTITYQDRTAATVCQIRREEALHIARIIRERP